MRDDGFYHEYYETESNSDTESDSDYYGDAAETTLNRSEINSNDSEIMEQYNAELLNLKTPTLLEKVGIPKLGVRDALDKKRIELLIDEITPEQFELKKAEYLAKADRIRNKRSRGGGYSNGGNSRSDFIGENSIHNKSTQTGHFSDHAYYSDKNAAGDKDGLHIFMLPLVIVIIFVLITVICLIGGLF